MPRVPSSYVIMEAEIEGVEVYTSAHDKQDAATVTMVAQIDATFAHGYTDQADAAPEVVAQITAANSRDLFDAATVSMTAVITASDGKEYSDAATAQVIADATTVELFAGVDAAEAIVISVPVTVDTKDSVDAATVSSVAVVSGVDDLTHNYVDAATVDVLGIASADEFMAHDYTEAATAQVIAADGDSPASHDEHENVDAATAQTQGIASGVDSQGYSDAATAQVVAQMDSIDGKEYSDSNTAQVQGIASGVEVYTPSTPATVLFGDQHYGGGSGVFGDPGRTLAIPIGGTAIAGDYLIIGTISSAGGSAPGTPPAVTDNISGSTGWVKDVDTSQGSGAYGSGVTHITYWKKQCVGGETTVTVDFFSSTNKAVAGAWTHVGTSAPYILRNTNASWGGITMDWNTAANHPVSNGETYITIALGGGSGVTDPGSFGYFTNQGGSWTGTETASLLKLASGECWARVGYGDSTTASPSHTIADQITMQETVNLPMYVTAYSYHP